MIKKLGKILKIFQNYYKRVTIGNIQREKKKSEAYNKALKHFLEETKDNNMYGDWDDNGRLRNIYE